MIVTEVDPICALQAAMDGQVARLEQVLDIADIYVTATGCRDVITADQMSRMKHQRSCPTSATSTTRSTSPAWPPTLGRPRSTSSRRWTNGQFTEDGSPAHSVIVLSEGRLMNLGNATGHPSFVMSNSFTNQVLAQIELFTKPEDYPRRYTLPKHLDEAVARLHLDALGARLTELTEKQAQYLGVPVDGPYKSEHYRY